MKMDRFLFDRDTRAVLGTESLSEWKSWLQECEASIRDLLEEYAPPQQFAKLAKLDSAWVDPWLADFLETPTGLKVASQLAPRKPDPEPEPPSEVDPKFQAGGGGAQTAGNVGQLPFGALPSVLQKALSSGKVGQVLGVGSGGGSLSVPLNPVPPMVTYPDSVHPDTYGTVGNYGKGMAVTNMASDIYSVVVADKSDYLSALHKDGYKLTDMDKTVFPAGTVLIYIHPGDGAENVLNLAHDTDVFSDDNIMLLDDGGSEVVVLCNEPYVTETDDFNEGDMDASVSSKIKQIIKAYSVDQVIVHM